MNLKEMRDEYCSTISIDSAALSYETIKYILDNLILDNFFVCDLGSGFSSYALRLKNTNITSVDDNDFWLQKTIKYCKSQEQTSGMFLLYENWKMLNQKYDLIIYDLGNRQTRVKEFETIVSKLKQDGTILIDDMHKQDMAQEILTKANKLGLNLLSLKNETIDSYKRFSYIGNFII
jgi:hypothetical protein